MVVEQLLSRLDGVRVMRQGESWQARCPAHEDRNPSLSVDVRDGRILLCCHAGCGIEAITEALGIRQADLFLDDQQRATPPQSEKEYRYTDEKGRYLYSVVRIEAAGKPKTFRQRTAAGWGLNGARRVPYRLPRALEAIAEETPLFLVEGEKDVDTLEAVGLYATCNSGGAGKWRDDYSGLLQYAQAVVLGDNDDAGRAHAAGVARSLYGKAKNVRILELPGLPPKGDVTDWLGNGGSRETLLELAATAPYYTGDVESPQHGMNMADAQVYVPSWDNRPAEEETLVTLSDSRILSRGNLALVTSGAGSGKSSVLEAACSSVVCPEADTLGIRIETGRVGYLDTERSRRDHHDSWTRYMRRAGLSFGDASPTAVEWRNLRGIAALEDRKTYLWNYLENGPDVVLIDGIGDFVGDPNDSDECTALVYRLSAIVHERNIGAVLTLHSNPATNSTKARGVLGSELWRKCEAVLIIKRAADGIRALTTDFDLGKNRAAADTISAYFRWDEDEHMHVSCSAPAAAGKPKVTRQREAITEAMGSREWTHTDLKAMVMSDCAKSERTAARWISELEALRLITKTTAGMYAVRPHDTGWEWIHD